MDYQDIDGTKHGTSSQNLEVWFPQKVPAAGELAVALKRLITQRFRLSENLLMTGGSRRKDPLSVAPKYASCMRFSINLHLESNQGLSFPYLNDRADYPLLLLPGLTASADNPCEAAIGRKRQRPEPRSALW
ncbi:hypothetical protein VTK26DRAFT_1906 [Humicola hyalothermophila]